MPHTPEVKKLTLNGRVYKLPFAELIPFDDAQLSALRDKIEAAGRVIVPIVCWSEKKTKTTDTVIDGAHRLTIAAALGLKKVPIIYLNFKSEEEARAKCEELNYDRRHLTPKQMQESRRQRIARIAAARAKGQSTRAIAEAEGISQPQVRRDLEAAGETPVSPDGNGHVETPDSPESVTGQDGKTYPAVKPAEPLILCARCQRVGATKDCKGCETLRREAKEKKPRKQADKPDVVDAGGKPVPKRCRAALKDPWIQRAIDFIGVTEASIRKERLADGMAKRKGHYPFFNVKDFTDGVGMVQHNLELLLEHLKEHRPAYVCPKCDGEGCGKCKTSGLVSRTLYKELKK